MTSLTVKYAGELVVTMCWCGIRQAIPSELMKQANHNGTTVYCPLGHAWVITKTEAEKLREQLEQKQRDLRWYENALTKANGQTDRAERSAAAYKGHLTRARNKIAAGQCPVPDCGQHFSNVREHMKFKHPDYHLTDPETGESVAP